MMFFNAVRAHLNERSTRSAWNKGVHAYALDLVAELETNVHDGYYTLDQIRTPSELEKVMLNGARDWSQYSWGGCALCYDWQVAKCLCTPSELKRTRNGERKPNPHEEWLDTQARALNQAAGRVRLAVRQAFEDLEV